MIHSKNSSHRFHTTAVYRIIMYWKPAQCNVLVDQMGWETIRNDQEIYCENYYWRWIENNKKRKSMRWLVIRFQQPHPPLFCGGSSAALGRLDCGNKFGFFSIVSAIFCEMASTRDSKVCLTFTSSFALVSKYITPNDCASSNPCSLVITRLLVRSLLLPTSTTLAFSHERSRMVDALEEMGW